MQNGFPITARGISFFPGIDRSLALNKCGRVAGKIDFITFLVEPLNKNRSHCLQHPPQAMLCAYSTAPVSPLPPVIMAEYLFFFISRNRWKGGKIIRPSSRSGRPRRRCWRIWLKNIIFSTFSKWIQKIQAFLRFFLGNIKLARWFIHCYSRSRMITTEPIYTWHINTPFLSLNTCDLAPR